MITNLQKLNPEIEPEFTSTRKLISQYTENFFKLLEEHLSQKSDNIAEIELLLRIDKQILKPK